MQTADIKYFDTDKQASTVIPGARKSNRNPAVFGLQCPKCDNELVLRVDERTHSDIHECEFCGYFED